eukprot:gb/GEZN01009153.1/.p1 GENE.gb/GEZN01009153.1/~~gb/GEZN01009153.1/.p1  ORF type:complete len:370 (-),score=83.88 gb/GEZN01009153.1/:117-1226(-)
MADKDKDAEDADKKEIADISDAKVLDKYKAAAEITNNALAYVISLVKPEAKVVEVIAAGDKYINEACTKIYNKPKMDKGIAFPTAISINHVVGHFSPLLDNTQLFAEGDTVKIDLGAHIDGYLAVAAHTIVLGPIAGRLGDCMLAAYYAGEAALRLLKPGGKNTEITKAIGQVSKEFDVNAVVGVVSHELKKNTIDGSNVILIRDDIDQKVDEVEFEPNTVYAIDIVMSTGEGKPIERDEKTTIFKRDPEKTYNLKFKASKAVFGKVIKEHPYFPFNIRDMDSKTIGFAIKECTEHGLLLPYPVLFEKEGESVVHFKYTAFITPNGTVQATTIPIKLEAIKAGKEIKSEELKALLASSVGKKKKKKKKK